MRAVARGVVIVVASVVLAVSVTLLIGSGDRPGPRPVPWTDVRLAAALTRISLGAPVRPDEVAAILARDCPYLPDPIGLVQSRHAGTEAEANAVESVLAQSGRC
jgi:hypothetical protein